MTNLQTVFKSRLFENFLSLGAIQGINYLLPLITIPFLYNQLGVENYGLVNFSFAFIQYFMMLTDFGFGLSGTRYISEHRGDKDQINRFLNSACIARFGMSVVSLSILLICLFFFPSFKNHKVFTLLFFGQVIGNVLCPAWFFQGMEKMKFNTILHITTRFISIIPLFFIIKAPEDYLYIPFFYSLGFITAGILSLHLIHKKFGMNFYFTSCKEVYSVLHDSAKYFLSRLSVSLFTNTNTFVLGLVCGNVAVGYYSLADKIYVALNSIYGPLNGALFPYMTNNKNLTLFKKILTFGFLINSVLIIMFYFIFPFVSPFFFSNYAVESESVLHILLISNIICLPATFFGYPFLAAFGHPNYCNYSLVASSIFHLLGLGFLYLSNNVSIFSVAYLVVACELFLLLFRIYGVLYYRLWR